MTAIGRDNAHGDTLRRRGSGSLGYPGDLDPAGPRVPQTVTAVPPLPGATMSSTLPAPRRNLPETLV
jgi:hypothetical protein